ncbi:PP2C family protein-serine/threonine phosphatase [Paeniglutamicibacter sp. R2-26]|uniref:PP2C family protein-serine/threonine phosphatase n=1 Tax=Paeniglutamicibacter sp. R2-26 TaxID=3144417 RepID=UPI003EE61E72
MHTHMGGIHGAALTDIGLRRAVNEDAVLSAGSIFAVADGMGGHEAGDLASRLCIETLEQLAVDPEQAGPAGLPHAQAVLAQVERADAMIRAAIGSRGGTTLCALALVSCEPGGTTWPQEPPSAATTLQLPVQPGSAAAPGPGTSAARYLDAVEEAHVHPADAVFRHGQVDDAGQDTAKDTGEPDPTTDVLPYTPAPGAGTPAVTRLGDPGSGQQAGPAPHADAAADSAADAGPGTGQDAGVRLMLLNVGDSRGYRLRGGKLTQLTLDHSAVQELIDAGTITEAEARIHPQRNLITRALGAGGNSVPDSQFHELVEGDRYLLCSDGLTGEVDPARIEHILNRVPDRAEAMTRLVDAALASGGRDNISVVVIDVSGPTRGD